MKRRSATPAGASRVASPLQDRSRRTLKRIVATAERMLEDGTFADATVQHIVHRARSSVGSFYARFHDKQTLLDHLVANVHDAMLERAARLRRDPRWHGVTLEERLSAYVAVVDEWTEAHRGILRARLLHHMTVGDAVPRDQVEKTRLLLEEVRAFFAPVRHSIRSAHPDRALNNALQLIDAMIGARHLLAGPGLQSFPPLDATAFRRNVGRAAFCLLQDD